MSHQAISFVKSGIRLYGYALIWPLSPVVSAVLFVSEVIGVIEEIGH